MKQRSIYWDNWKGFLIFLVVLGHFFIHEKSIIGTTILYTIYLFHMQAFLFVSGYLSKNKDTCKNEKIKRLLYFYLLGNFLLMIYSYIVDKTPLMWFTPYYSFWYLLALMCYRKIIQKCSKRIGISTLIFSFCIALWTGFFKAVNNTFALSRIFAFFPFFLLGYLLPKDTIKTISNRKKITLLLGIFLLICTLGSFIIMVPFFNMNDFLMEPYQNISSFFHRILIFLFSFFVIFASSIIIPDKKLSWITTWGKNSFSIFFYHRILTLLLEKILSTKVSSTFYIVLSILFTILLCLLLGRDNVTENTEKMYQKGIEWTRSIPKSFKKKVAILMSLLLLFLSLFLPIHTFLLSKNQTEQQIFQVLNDQQKQAQEDAFSILYSGDFILLEEQIKRGYNELTDQYDFHSIFDNTRKYITSADLSIGVLEGPVGIENIAYTESNFDDDIPLSFHFPKEFLKAIKDAGFDLVTLANNHMLDQKENGARTTKELVQKYGLESVGVIDKDEEMRGKIIEKNGLKIGVLAYTYGLNGYKNEEFKKQSIIPILVSKDDKQFSKVKEQVLEDFRLLKEKSPDTIIVLPHMGTQFSNQTDAFQETWNKIFIEAGADLILGDHSHSVQPITYKTKKDGEKAIIVNSPGNFINSYTDKKGDATSMVEIYINKKTGKVIASSLIPMWTEKGQKGNYQASPIFDLIQESRLNPYEESYLDKLYQYITKVMIQEEIPLDASEEKLYFDEHGYYRKKVSPLIIDETLKKSSLYHKIEKATSICFIGDSITAGNRNGGYPWYEPLINAFKEKDIYNISKGGATVKTIQQENLNVSADLYIIAIGINDIRYRDQTICAMNEEEYKNEIKQIIKNLPLKSNSQIILIAPWYSLPSSQTNLSTNEMRKLVDSYGKTLQTIAQENQYYYINANFLLEKEISKKTNRTYLLDSIHPNRKKGIYLYSQAVLEASK